jgi:hypothetical protein
MYTKPIAPTIETAMSKKFDLFQYLYEVRKTVRENLDADMRRPIDQQEFTPYLIGDLLDEVCASIDLVEQQAERDPTDDICDGEPPLSADEIHRAAWKQHLEAHS